MIYFPISLVLSATIPRLLLLPRLFRYQSIDCSYSREIICAQYLWFSYRDNEVFNTTIGLETLIRPFWLLASTNNKRTDLQIFQRLGITYYPSRYDVRIYLLDFHIYSFYILVGQLNIAGWLDLITTLRLPFSRENQSDKNFQSCIKHFYNHLEPTVN